MGGVFSMNVVDHFALLRSLPREERERVARALLAAAESIGDADTAYALFLREAASTLRLGGRFRPTGMWNPPAVG